MKLNVNSLQFAALMLTYAIIFVFRRRIDRSLGRHAEYMMDNWQDDFESPRPKSADDLRRTYWGMLLIFVATLVLAVTKAVIDPQSAALPGFERLTGR
ncbi:hypothetical protein [Bosea sp. UNC402CLCol]|uniref:hypothetical protein n=1 Tax=Bosea sp. UNC402CLCol TaxID=1510531 RepID=UPI0012E039A1|nr:hypothetical protein [Bosea sp. UNC402CLCol]